MTRGRPRIYGERTTKLVRLDPALANRLTAVAQEREVSVNRLITRAIEDYLVRLPPLDELLPTRAVDRDQVTLDVSLTPRETTPFPVIVMPASGEVLIPHRNGQTVRVLTRDRALDEGHLHPAQADIQIPHGTASEKPAIPAPNADEAS
ncbi:MAG: CopG family transcriptional regulator [Actinomycetota bacterium]